MVGFVPPEVGVYYFYYLYFAGIFITHHSRVVVELGSFVNLNK